MAFNEADTDQGGSLSQDEFVRAFGDVLGKNMTKQELDKLQMRIDANSDGEVNWDEFMNYVLLENQNMASMREKQSEQDKVSSPDPSGAAVHSEMISGITKIGSSSKRGEVEEFSQVTCSKDGTFREWGADGWTAQSAMNLGKDACCTCVEYLPVSNRVAVSLVNGRVVFQERGNDSKWQQAGEQKQHQWVGMAMEVIRPGSASDDFKEHLVVGDDQGQLHLFSFMRADWHICNLTSPCEMAVTTSNLEDKYKAYQENIKQMHLSSDGLMPSSSSSRQQGHQKNKQAKDSSNNITHQDIIEQMSIEMIHDLRKGGVLDDFHIMQKKLTEDDLIKYQHQSSNVSISHKKQDRLVVDNDSSKEKDDDHGKANEKIRNHYYFNAKATAMDTSRHATTSLYVTAMKYVSDVENLIVCYSSGLIFVLRLEVSNSSLANKRDSGQESGMGGSMFDARAELQFQRNLQIHKKAINCLIYSKNYKLAATAGEERNIVLWDIYTRKTNKVLTGHMSGVISLTTNEAMNQLISLSNDKNVRVWDIRNMLCIQSLFDSTVQRPENRLGHILFDEKSKSIVLTSRKLNVWPLRVQEGSTNQNDFPVTQIIFNDKFMNLISVDDGSNVLIFDLITGRMEFRFYQAHGPNRITAARLDSSKRRLITAAVNGTIKMWNFSNGAMLHDFTEDSSTTAEITDIVCLDSDSKSSEIIAVGWDRVIQVQAQNKPSRLIGGNKGQDKSNNEHTDDILKVFQIPKQEIVVTGMHDGSINVWHQRLGQIVAHLHKSDPTCLSENKKPAEELKSVEFIGLIHLNVERDPRDLKPKDDKALITCSADGLIRFWGTSYFEGGLDSSSFEDEKLKFKYSLKREGDSPKLSLTAVDINEELETLVAAFENGGFQVFSLVGIEDVLDNPTNPMVAMAHFRMLQQIKAQDCPINSIQIIKADLPDPKKHENKSINLIATAGEDTLIHLWHLQHGTKVGTFGSGVTWNLQTQDPLAPHKSNNTNQDDAFNRLKENKHRHIIGTDKRQDIGEIEKSNENKLKDIDEKLRELIQSKSNLDMDLDNEEEVIKSTLQYTYINLRVQEKFIYQKTPWNYLETNENPDKLKKNNKKK